MKIIRTPEDHKEMLARIDTLMARGEKLTTKERDELEVLAVLVEKYEQETHVVAPPTPLEAIRFRMEQMGYRQKDLARLLGAASRASEVLAGKRPLTPQMMRALRDEWGIPADSLLGCGPEDPAPAPDKGPARDPKDYPMKQMYEHGYFRVPANDWKNLRKDLAGLLLRFFPQGVSLPLSPTLCRQGGGEKARINPHALDAWRWRVLTRAAEEKSGLPVYRKESLDEGFLRWLCGLSALKDGPRLACEALEEKGIAVIIEPRLDHTYLDGAALLDPQGRPVIGLTLRHDRLDNFWFTLFHEIGHVLLHLSADHPALFDSEIDQKKTGRIETEADRFALDTMIPPEIWQQVRRLDYADEIRAVAKRLCLSPAVIAGRLRREANDYRKHRTLVGNKQAREVFGYKEETWPK